MSIIYNDFPSNLETAFMQIIKGYLQQNYKNYQIVSVVNTAGDQDQYQPIETTGPDEPAEALILNLPRVVCSADSCTEAIYQTGIYQVNMSIIIKANLDGQGGFPQAKALYSSVLDAIQMVHLKQQLNLCVDNNNNRLVLIKGIVLNEQRLNETIERMFQKTVSMDTFGFSFGASGVQNQAGNIQT